MLSLKRKADRVKMADRLEAITKKYGATVERRDHVGDLLCDAREITLRIKLGPHGLNIDLDAQFDFIIGSWYGSEKLPNGFGPAIRGPVNEYHGHKATSHAGVDQFEEFCKSIENGLALIAKNQTLAPSIAPDESNSGLAPALGGKS